MNILDFNIISSVQIYLVLQHKVFTRMGCLTLGHNEVVLVDLHYLLSKSVAIVISGDVCLVPTIVMVVLRMVMD